MDLYLQRDERGAMRLKEGISEVPHPLYLSIEIEPPAETAEEAFARGRAKRIAKRVEIETALAGDPMAAADVRRDFQPLLDASQQAQRPVEEDDIDSEIVINQDLNL